MFYFNRLNTGTGVWSTEQSVPGAAGTYSDVISLLIFPWMTNPSAWWVNANNDVDNRNFHVTDANPPVATNTGTSAYSPNSIMWYKAGGGGTDRVFFQGGSTNTSIMSYNPNGTPATSTLWKIPSGMGGTVWYCAANDLFYVPNQNYQTYVVNTSGTLVGFVRQEFAAKAAPVEFIEVGVGLDGAETPLVMPVESFRLSVNADLIHDGGACIQLFLFGPPELRTGLGGEGPSAKGLGNAERRDDELHIRIKKLPVVLEFVTESGHQSG